MDDLINKAMGVVLVFTLGSLGLIAATLAVGLIMQLTGQLCR